jgi:hypothetical protein
LHGSGLCRGKTFQGLLRATLRGVAGCFCVCRTGRSLAAGPPFTTLALARTAFTCFGAFCRRDGLRKITFAGHACVGHHTLDGLAVRSTCGSCFARLLARSTIRAAFTTFATAFTGLPALAWLAPLPGLAALARFTRFANHLSVAFAAWLGAGLGAFRVAFRARGPLAIFRAIGATASAAAAFGIARWALRTGLIGPGCRVAGRQAVRAGGWDITAHLRTGCV